MHLAPKLGGSSMPQFAVTALSLKPPRLAADRVEVRLSQVHGARMNLFDSELNRAQRFELAKGGSCSRAATSLRVLGTALRDERWPPVREPGKLLNLSRDS